VLAPFFKHLRLGVDLRHVKRLVSAAGYDPSLLDTPDAPSPYAVDGGGDGGVLEAEGMSVSVAGSVVGDGEEVAETVVSVDQHGPPSLADDDYLDDDS
jgi:hypothetical protein